MVTDEQRKILDMLCQPKKSKYLSEKEYDNLGMYGSRYCTINDYDEDCIDEEEEDGDWQ